MRFVTIHYEGADRVGRLHAGAVHLLPAGVRLVDLLGDDGERLHRAGEAALADPEVVLPAGAVRLRPPIPLPPTLRDFMAFEQHVEGTALAMGDDGIGPEWYQLPYFYFSNPYALVGAYDDVPVPPGCHVFDFELEVAAVVGLPGRDLSPEDAERHIIGYTILNDWSARDVQRHEMRAHLGPVKGKDSATTLGPALVTPDELEDARCGPSFDLRMSVSVNGTEIGTDRLSNMAWSFAEMVSYASRGTWVGPGDILGSGTCGNGCLAEAWGRRGRDTLPPLAPGDVVEMTVDRLGTIRNRVVAGGPFVPLTARRARRVNGAPPTTGPIPDLPRARRPSAS